MIPLDKAQVYGNRKVITSPIDEAKEHLRRNGWSYRRAAAALGKHPMHLAKVLSGVRVSSSLLRSILSLGPASDIPTKSAYRATRGGRGGVW